MCLEIITVSLCPTCDAHLGGCKTRLWCKEAFDKATVKKGTFEKDNFGSCGAGPCCDHQEYRGKECDPCAEIREQAMDEMDMEDFAEKRLGWDRGGDSDDDGGYGW